MPGGKKRSLLRDSRATEKVKGWWSGWQIGDRKHFLTQFWNWTWTLEGDWSFKLLGENISLFWVILHTKKSPPSEELCGEPIQRICLLLQYFRLRHLQLPNPVFSVGDYSLPQVLGILWSLPLLGRLNCPAFWDAAQELSHRTVEHWASAVWSPIL
jgi:hypothetical protein